jgi:hypothetical protein
LIQWEEEWWWHQARQWSLQRWNALGRYGAKEAGELSSEVEQPISLEVLPELLFFQSTTESKSTTRRNIYLTDTLFLVYFEHLYSLI